jgi:uncharacterized membrane-anchored protein
MTLNLGYEVGIAITLAFFLVVLFMQLSAKKFIPFIFWLVIIGTTTLGTEISDYIDRSLHLGYLWGSILLMSFLFFTLLLWFNKFKNLEVYPITDRQKEIFYWIAILFSNSLGTAFGDMLGDSFGLSYIQGAMVTGGVIIFVVGLHYFTKINHVLLFWVAFIFTRPFGATFGDFLTKPLDKGGLDLGTLVSSLVSVLIMLVLLFFSYRKLKLRRFKSSKTLTIF